MIITLTVISLFLISLIILIVSKVKGDDWRDWDDLTGRTIFTVIMGIILLIVIIFLIGEPLCQKANLVRFNSAQKSLETARANPDVTPLELATIQKDVIELNAWLVGAQFWAKLKLTSWFWPKEILEAIPIK